MTARVLVSACLLGERVRYDGGHKRDEHLLASLEGRIQLVPVCPEVESGLPIPREPMRLAGDPASPSLIAVKSGTDHTEPVMRWTHARLRELESQDLCGYVCKRNSPCCSGKERIAVLGDPFPGALSGTGLFTKAFMEHFPEVPVEDEGRLRDIALMDLFLEKVFALRRQRDERS